MESRLGLILWASVIFLWTAGWPLGMGASPMPEHASIPGEPLVGTIDGAHSEATLSFRGQRLFVWSFATNQFKPYVRELYTVRGENVLVDAPADHLHHHGLMYAVSVNGVNFWEERPPAGRQVPDGPPTWEFGRSIDGLPRAILRQSIRWQPADDDAPKAALLRERRVLTVSVDPGLEEVSVHWQADFEPIQERVRLHGADYNGLGLRLPREFDRVAVFRNPDGQAYSEAQTGDIRPVDWTSVAGTANGRDVTLALAADPANPGVSTFFSMRNAFAYLSATQSLGKTPVECRRGDRFRLRYLLVIYPAHQNLDFLSQRIAAKLKSS